MSTKTFAKTISFPPDFSLNFSVKLFSPNFPVFQVSGHPVNYVFNSSNYKVDFYVNKKKVMTTCIFRY